MKRITIVLLICLVVFGSSNSDPIGVTGSAFDTLNGILSKDVAKKIFERVDLVKLLDIGGPIVSLIGGALSIIGILSDNTAEKLEEILNELKKLDIIIEQIDNLSSQINQLSDFIINENDRTIGKIKMERVVPILVGMNSNEGKLPNIIAAYSHDNKTLVRMLNELINDYDYQNFEVKLIQHVFMGFVGYTSLASEIFDAGRKYHQGVLNPRDLRTSTYKTLHDLSFALLAKILRSFEVQRLAIAFKLEASGEQEDEHELNYLEIKKNQSLRSLDASIKTFQNRINDDDFSTYINFATIPRDPVRFKNILQTFFDRETNLSGGTCKGTCEDYRFHSHNQNGCSGRVRNCETTRRRGCRVTTSSASDRIYEGYFFSGRWWGLGDPNGGTSLDGWTRGFVYCDICRCTCDQFSNPNTVRRVFIGRLRAPHGYVVTGVRFAEENRIIFLQPQVGKLLPMGLIDAATIHWMGLPSHPLLVGLNVAGLNDRFNLGTINKLASNQVVTAIQLVNFGSTFGFELKVFGNTILNFENGILSHIQEEGKSSERSFNYKSIGGRVGWSTYTLKFTVTKYVHIIFRRSDEGFDAGQSFLPYFDSREVTFDPPAPVSMIDLVHYTNEWAYAGYIRPVIRPLNYGNFFENYVI